MNEQERPISSYLTDRDDKNPVDMTAEEWAEFYGDCQRRTGMDFDEYLDHDHSMDG